MAMGPPLALALALEFYGMVWYGSNGDPIVYPAVVWTIQL